MNYASGSSPGAVIGGIVLYLAAMLAYITPLLVASYRRSDKLSPVVVVNIFLGWTVVGWVVALAMAVSGPSGRRPPGPGFPQPPPGPPAPWR